MAAHRPAPSVVRVFRTMKPGEKLIEALKTQEDSDPHSTLLGVFDEDP